MQVRTVAVIGAGTMGSGIAQICAQSGWDTRLFDVFPESLEKGMNNINSFWNKGIEKGKTSIEDKELWSKNLNDYNDLSEAVKGVDLVIEALGFEPEDLPIMFSEPSLNVTQWGTIKVDYKNLMTSLDGVFAAGDIVRGASLVVWGIKDGRDVANHIHNYLGNVLQCL